jgi:hypothetical protein
LKRTLIGTSAIRISLGAAVCALLAIPVACSDDDAPPADNTEAGTGGEDGTGGKGSGGKGGSANGGSAGKANGGSGGSMGGSSGAGGAGGKAGSAGAGGKATGGTDGGTDVPDAEPPVPDGSAGSGGSAGDAGDAAPPVNPCPDPAELTDGNPNNAKVCLTFAPETMALSTTETTLDGKGVLLIQFYDTDTLTPTTVPLKAIQYPPPPATVLTANESVYSLPQIDVEGLPETVYMRVLFVDNQGFFVPAVKTLTWGMFIGGLDLSAGVLPPPKLRKLTLTNDKGTLHPTTLTALRRISTTVELGTLDTAHGSDAIKDDGQGPISVGCFDVSAPSNQPVRGGVALPCTNINAGPKAANAFTYGSGDRWVGAQLDDFNQGGTAKPGNIASLGGGTGGQSILDSQRITFAADQYSATLTKVVLNFVIPGATPPTAPFVPYACP